MGNLVAIVGRPNVGKSTLFNRLTKSRQAIVSDEAGTTRDRQYGKCDWNGREFSVVDTGGWVVNSDDVFEEEIRKQVIIATEEADLVLFLCDINNGVTGWDMDVAQILRRGPTTVRISTISTSSISLVSAIHIQSLLLQVVVLATCSTRCSRCCQRKLRMTSRTVYPVSLLLVVLMQVSQVSSTPSSARSVIS